MTAYAKNWTARYILQYRSLGISHDMQFRLPIGTEGPSSDFIAGVVSFLNVLVGTRHTDWAILGAIFIPAGSEFGLPATAPDETASGTAAISTQSDATVYMRFVGTTIGGNPMNITVFGTDMRPQTENATPQADYRLTSAESSYVSNGRLALASIPGLVGNDNNPIIWKHYANLGYNAHLQHTRRG